jgi:hypothetical protein
LYLLLLLLLVVVVLLLFLRQVPPCHHDFLPVVASMCLMGLPPLNNSFLLY